MRVHAEHNTEIISNCIHTATQAFNVETRWDYVYVYDGPRVDGIPVYHPAAGRKAYSHAKHPQSLMMTRLF